MRVLFVEPPKKQWFLMGEYLPPPYGILALAAYLEKHRDSDDIAVLDCQAEDIDWKGLEKRIESFRPDVLASSALATCNAFTVMRTVEVAKEVNPNITTVTGGQHFTATAQESLESSSNLDVIVRGEGEQTLVELIRALDTKQSFSKVRGLSFRRDGKIIHTEDRPLIDDLDTLPYPGYHFVRENMKKYHFTMMGGQNTPYALVEGSRGCDHHCSFCTQWRYWRGCCRPKSPKRIADEFEYCHNEFGSKFLWLTDDNFGLGQRASKLADEIIDRRLGTELMWFMQARSDDIIKHQDVLPKLRASGNMWILVGLESHSPETLSEFNKGIDPLMAKQAMNLLKKNDIFAQATIIIGNRKDSRESLNELRKWIDKVNPDIAIFMILTPLPGAELYQVASRNGWIEDDNWGVYDMVHATMPTETLSRPEVQEELYKCYRAFYGSWKRRITGLFSSNALKRRTYRYLMRQGVLKALRGFF
ncbi:MAG: B12-binding domain-containing radical SAM protein [Promethearchaeota archaeon]